MKNNLERRNFLKLLGLTSAAVIIPTFFRKAAAQTKAAVKDAGKAVASAIALPAGQKAVPADDAVAKAIGYKQNVADIDYKKYPKRKEASAKDQFCKNCNLYTKQNDGWGKCTMINSGLVSANGWCGSWNGPKKS